MWCRALKNCNLIKTICKFVMVILVFALTGCEGEASSGKDSYDNTAACWQTYILNATLRIIDQLFTDSASKVVNGGPTVILIGFSVWMAFKLLKVLSSFKEESIGEVWTEIGHKLFLCSFCAWGVYSVANVKEIVDIYVIPVYNALLELSSRTLDMKSETIQLPANIGSISYSGQVQPTCTAVMDANSIKNSISPMASCLICNIGARLNAGVKVGLFLISNGSIAGVIVGAIISLCFFLAKLGFVLYLVDALFRINFAVVLIPIFIMGIPFPYTRKWSLHTFLMFINSSGAMLFMGLLVSICVGTLQQILRYIGPQLDAGNTDGMGPVMMAILMIAILLFNVPGFAISLADKFVEGGGSTEAMKKISKFVIDLAKKVGYAALSYVTQGATQEVTDALQEYERIREIHDTAKQKLSQVRNKLNDIAGYNG